MRGGALTQQSVNRALVWIARHPMAQVGGAPGRRVARVTGCGTCGAPVRKKDFALRCRSCGGFLAQDSDLVERARPDGLLPFAIDEEAARAAVATWISSRRLAPRTLLTGDRRPHALDAVFLPLWSFSANTITDYAGRRGERRVSSAGGHRRSYTAWHKAAGRVERYFDAVVLPGCSPLAEKLPPWSLDRLVPYAQGASKGRRIIAYDVEPEHGFEQARIIMNRQIQRDVREAIGGSSQQVKDVTTWYADPAYSLLLLPVWLATYVHDGRSRSVLVNGTSGRVVGARPYSAGKIFALVGSLTVLVIAAGAAFALTGR